MHTTASNVAASAALSPHDEKSTIRERVAACLLAESEPGRGPIALPDVVFDRELDHFITDFNDSDRATHHVLDLPEWQAAGRVFITPDNSTQRLREAAIRSGKQMIMTTYGIRRGSVLVTRDLVPPGQEEYASTLAGMERFGRRLPTIADLEAAGPLDLMITGALAISRAHGGRAGKGAGWFDAEWGIWGALGLIGPETPVVGIVHDVQVVPEAFALDPWDCRITIIATPSGIQRVPRPLQPHGVLWDEITTPQQMRWLAAIPYMRELYRRHFGRELPQPPE